MASRVVVIIKHHALEQRFEMESKMQEAGFEIVKERQMEFDTETDPEYLEELFGLEAKSLAEGAVRVYVLEREDAISEIQRMTDSSIMFSSPDEETAELQISSLFASSPPFPTSALPSESVTSTGTSVTSHSKRTASKSTSPPVLTKTLRRAPLTQERIAQTFANVPGHKRAGSIAVPSTAAPVIQPRMTKAAALRLGIALPTVVKRANTIGTFEGVPGHKRRETISVPALAPAVQPRSNRSAALRQSGPPPPTSFMFRTSTQPQSRPASAQSARPPSRSTSNPTPSTPSKPKPTAPKTPKPPSIQPRTNKAAALRAAKKEEDEKRAQIENNRRKRASMRVVAV